MKQYISSSDWDVTKRDLIASVRTARGRDEKGLRHFFDTVNDYKFLEQLENYVKNFNYPPSNEVLAREMQDSQAAAAVSVGAGKAAPGGQGEPGTSAVAPAGPVKQVFTLRPRENRKQILIIGSEALVPEQIRSRLIAQGFELRARSLDRLNVGVVSSGVAGIICAVNDASLAYFRGMWGRGLARIPFFFVDDGTSDNNQTAKEYLLAYGRHYNEIMPSLTTLFGVEPRQFEQALQDILHNWNYQASNRLKPLYRIEKPDAIPIAVAPSAINNRNTILILKSAQVSEYTKEQLVEQGYELVTGGLVFNQLKSNAHRVAAIIVGPGDEDGLNFVARFYQDAGPYTSIRNIPLVYQHLSQEEVAPDQLSRQLGRYANSSRFRFIYGAADQDVPLNTVLNDVLGQWNQSLKFDVNPYVGQVKKEEVVEAGDANRDKAADHPSDMPRISAASVGVGIPGAHLVKITTSPESINNRRIILVTGPMRMPPTSYQQLRDLGYEVKYGLEKTLDYVHQSPEQIALIIASGQAQGLTFINRLHTDSFPESVRAIPIIYQHLLPEAYTVEKLEEEIGGAVSSSSRFKFVYGQPNQRIAFNQVLELMLGQWRRPISHQENSPFLGVDITVPAKSVEGAAAGALASMPATVQEPEEVAEAAALEAIRGEGHEEPEAEPEGTTHVQHAEEISITVPSSTIGHRDIVLIFGGARVSAYTQAQLQEQGYRVVFGYKEAMSNIRDNSDKIAAIIIGPNEGYGLDFTHDFYMSGGFSTVRMVPLIYQHLSGDQYTLALLKRDIGAYATFSRFKFVYGFPDEYVSFNQVLNEMLGEWNKDTEFNVRSPFVGEEEGNLHDARAWRRSRQPAPMAVASDPGTGRVAQTQVIGDVAGADALPVPIAGPVLEPTVPDASNTYLRVPKERKVILVVGDEEHLPLAQEVQQALAKDSDNFFYPFVRVENVDEAKAFLKRYDHNVAALIGTTADVFMFPDEMGKSFPFIVKEKGNQAADTTAAILARVNGRRGSFPEGALTLYMDTNDRKLLGRLKTIFNQWSYPAVDMTAKQDYVPAPAQEDPDEEAADAVFGAQASYLGGRTNVLVMGSQAFKNAIDAKIEGRGFVISQTEQIKDAIEYLRTNWRHIAFIVANSSQAINLFREIKHLSGGMFAPVFVPSSGTELFTLIAGKRSVIQGLNEHAITFVQPHENFVGKLEAVLKDWTYAPPDDAFTTPASLGDEGGQDQENGDVKPHQKSRYLTSQDIRRNIVIDMGHNLSVEETRSLTAIGFQVEVVEAVTEEVSRSINRRFHQIAAIIRDDGEFSFKYYRGVRIAIFRAGRQFEFPFIIRPRKIYTAAQGQGQALIRTVAEAKQAITGEHKNVLVLAAEEHSLQMIFRSPDVNFIDAWDASLRNFFKNDAAMVPEGGIDFKDIQVNAHQQGKGIAFNIDAAMLKELNGPDFNGFDFQIDLITPISRPTSI